MRAARAATRVIAIGAKPFTEQYVLAELLGASRRRSRRRAASCCRRSARRSRFDALRRDELDVYVDYSGTIWATIMHREALRRAARRGARARSSALPRGRARRPRRLRARLREHATRSRCAADDARARGVARISRARAARARSSRIGADYEFLARPEWRALRDALRPALPRGAQHGPLADVRRAAAGQVDVISAFSTDGRIDAERLAVLEDDRGVIPPYDAILLASPRLARERPDAARGARDGSQARSTPPRCAA